jgi:hypothetical protein
MSKNAVTGDGTSFGKLDENIKKGMPVDKAVNRILKAIYLRDRECYLCSAFYKFVVTLSALSGNVTNPPCHTQYQDQLRVMNAAKKD